MLYENIIHNVEENKSIETDIKIDYKHNGLSIKQLLKILSMQ